MCKIHTFIVNCSKFVKESIILSISMCVGHPIIVLFYITLLLLLSSLLLLLLLLFFIELQYYNMCAQFYH